MTTPTTTAIPMAKATCPLCKVTFLFEYGVRRHDVRAHLGNMHPNIRYEKSFEAAMDKMLATAEPVAPAAGETPSVVVTADDLAEMLETSQSIERGLRGDLDGMVRALADERAVYDLASEERSRLRHALVEISAATANPTPGMTDGLVEQVRTIARGALAVKGGA